MASSLVPARVVAPANPLTEFYLTTVWQYQPVAAKRIIDELNLNYPGAEIIYDTEFHWFKVICPLQDQRQLTEVFSYIAADVEDDAFMKDHTKLLDSDGRIKLGFENDLLMYENDSDMFDSDWILNPLDDYSFPSRLLSYPYKEVWTKLEGENITIRHVITQAEIERLQSDSAVEMESDAPGKLVYMASHDPENIDKVKAKLDVLLEYSKLPASRPEHLLYTEGYTETGERARDEFLADIRYMANINPRLPSSTLLDPACVSNLENAYKKMYEQGASVRLCRWDSSKGRHFSTFGPDIKGRAGPRYPLGNRPPIFLPMDTGRGRQAKNALPLTIPNTQLAVKEEKEALVAKWMEDWPTESSMSVLEDAAQASTTDEYHTATPTAYPQSLITEADRIIEDIRSIAQSSRAREGKKGQLMSLVNELVNSADRSRSSSSQTQCQTVMGKLCPGESATGSRIGLRPVSSFAQVESGLAWEESIHRDRPIAIMDPIERSAVRADRLIQLEVPGLFQVPRRASPKAPEEARPPSPVKPKFRPSPPNTITWTMAPLVPERVHVHANPAPSTSPIPKGNYENKKVFKRYNDPDAGAFNTMDQNGKSRRPIVSESSYIHGTKINVPKSSKAAGKSAMSSPYRFNTFNTEISEAMTRLLLISPYQRGKVSVRADFGRIILGGMHKSTLAFNNSTTPSRGWKKEALLKHLNDNASERDHIHFTKILSTFGSDLEQMINTRDLSGNRLWQATPCRSWVVYSFRSVYINGDKDIPILIDCIFGPEGKSYMYDITPFNGGNDGVTPLYVHGLRRNWDLRIQMASFDSQLLESALGRTVRRFLDTVRVLNINVDETDLKYTLVDPSSLVIKEVRVLTKWRYLNATMKSELEITEVEPLSTKVVSEGKKREYRSQTPPKRGLKLRASRGIAARWYEASVVSTTMERLFKENEKLEFGEKASWDIQTLRNYQGENVFNALYGPALQMLGHMDQIGGNDCNNMPEGPEYEVRQRNDEITVPGYSQTVTATAPTAEVSTQVSGRPPNRNRPVPVPAPRAPSTLQQQWQRQGRDQARNNSETGPRARRDARMGSTERSDKMFW